MAQHLFAPRISHMSTWKLTRRIALREKGMDMIAGMTDSVRAAVLAEALPWLQHYRNKIVVVKYGANVMVDEDLKRAFAADMVFLRTVAAKHVVVQRGSPQMYK